ITQVLEPRNRLWWEVMTALGGKQETVKFLDQPVRPAFGVFQSFTDRPTDFSLYTILVKRVKKYVQVIVQRNFVPVEHTAFAKHLIDKFTTHRPDLDILAGFFVHFGAEMRQERFKIIGRVHQERGVV